MARQFLVGVILVAVGCAPPPAVELGDTGSTVPTEGGEPSIQIVFPEVQVAPTEFQVNDLCELDITVVVDIVNYELVDFTDEDLELELDAEGEGHWHGQLATEANYNCATHKRFCTFTVAAENIQLGPTSLSVQLQTNGHDPLAAAIDTLEVEVTDPNGACGTRR